MTIREWLSSSVSGLWARLPQTVFGTHPCPNMVYVDSRAPTETSNNNNNLQPPSASLPELLSTRPVCQQSPTNADTTNTTTTTNSSTPRQCQNINTDVRRSLNGIWSTNGASLFACFLCCVNFYTLCRFSLLAYFFKGAFLAQFIILSFVFGVPLLLFLMSVGQYLGAGYIDMWFISPAFRGIGYAFMLTYAMISIYASVPIAWLFVYFRDSFLATRDTPFRGLIVACNSTLKSWLLAARETFIIWTAFGGAALSVCGHNKVTQNLIRQAVILLLLVITVLILSACFFASAMEAITRRGLVFTPSSFEKANDTSFVTDRRLLLPTLDAADLKITTGSNLFLGANLITAKAFDRESHYAIMRFASEIYPAALAIEGPTRISSFWAMTFYLAAILLNIGFVVVLWGTVIDAVIALDRKRLKQWRTTIGFAACAIAFIFCLPFATPSGYSFIYYLDFCFASLWWLALLHLLMVVAVLIIRGRPIGTENLVNMLVETEATRNWFLPAVTFYWNLISPVAVMILSICFTRSYSATGLTWTQVVSVYPHWPPWAQWLSIGIQILPLFIVFTYGVFQVTFYLVTKQGPVYDRLQLLFCPTITVSDMRRRGTFVDAHLPPGGLVNSAFVDDPPPKYTPPPSYSTATSRDIRKALRGRLASSVTIDLHNVNCSNANISRGVSVEGPSSDIASSERVSSKAKSLSSLPPPPSFAEAVGMTNGKSSQD